MHSPPHHPLYLLTTATALHHLQSLHQLPSWPVLAPQNRSKGLLGSGR
eukprot:COSAG02_NODE_47999_length_337_cov_0.651261_1_plen_47_part_01